MWVDEMAANANNPVLYYKQQGNKDPTGLLSIDDFALIIMTRSQKDIFKKYGRDKICVDGTHGLHPYDFILHTMLVVDEYGNGFPAAFCFSNCSNESLLEIFFLQLKSQVSEMQTNVFMSDDAPAYYNAWKKVMGSAPHQLLCSWHVSRNWMENLSKIKAPEKKKMVFKVLKALRDELSTDNFNTMLNKLMEDLDEDDETKRFGQYFRDHYSSRPNLWAYCHRIRLGINTNMYLESLHEKIKYQYLDGKVIKRLDMAINALLKMVRDLLFDRYKID